jgi:hypothetical protein
MDWDYFEFGHHGHGPDIRPNSYVYKRQLVPDSFRIGSARYHGGTTGVPNRDATQMDGQFVFDIRNGDSFWRSMVQVRAFYMPSVPYNQWGIDPHTVRAQRPRRAGGRLFLHAICLARRAARGGPPYDF